MYERELNTDYYESQQTVLRDIVQSADELVGRPAAVGIIYDVAYGRLVQCTGLPADDELRLLHYGCHGDDPTDGQLTDLRQRTMDQLADHAKSAISQAQGAAAAYFAAYQTAAGRPWTPQAIHLATLPERATWARVALNLPYELITVDRTNLDIISVGGVELYRSAWLYDVDRQSGTADETRYRLLAVDGRVVRATHYPFIGQNNDEAVEAPTADLLYDLAAELAGNID